MLEEPGFERPILQINPVDSMFDVKLQRFKARKSMEKPI